MKILSWLLRFLPAFLRHKLIRKYLLIQPIHETGFRFKIATTQEELEAAFSLLHDCYVHTGLMDPHPSGMRCTVYSALPYTTTIIAKKGDQVVGTVSLIRDSALGFPSDKDYKRDNDHYRSKGCRMVEASALAVKPDFRDDHRISFHLMKYLYEYSTRYMGCDMICATVHPRTYDFYSALLGFRRNGEVISYGFVKGALAIHITLDTVVAYRELMPRLYQGAPAKRDLFSFMTASPAPFDFPNRNQGCVLDPVMTPEMLRYFFIERTDLFSRLSKTELELIHSAYDLNFDMSSIPNPKTETPDGRSFRYPMEIEAALLSDSRIAIGKLLNLSTGGMRFESSELLQDIRTYEAIFNLGGDHFRLPAVVRWHRKGERSTYGIQFLATDIRLLKALRSIHHNPEAKPDKVPEAA